MSWIILCEFVEDFFLDIEFKDIVQDFSGFRPDIEQADYLTQNFIPVYDLQDSSELMVTITCFYFAFTSLTTVGFGDFHPISEFE
jgi:hypothetical protein